MYGRKYAKKYACLYVLLYVLLISPAVFSLTSQEINSVNDLAAKNNISNSSLQNVFLDLENQTNLTNNNLSFFYSLFLNYTYNNTFNYSIISNSSSGNYILILGIQKNISSLNLTAIDNSQIRADIKTINDRISKLDPASIANASQNFQNLLDTYQNESSIKFETFKTQTEAKINATKNQIEADTNEKISSLTANVNEALKSNLILGIIIAVLLAFGLMFALHKKGIMFKTAITRDQEILLRQMESLLTKTEAEKMTQADMVLNESYREKTRRVRLLKAYIHMQDLPNKFKRHLLDEVDKAAIRNEDEVKEQIKIYKKDEEVKNYEEPEERKTGDKNLQMGDAKDRRMGKKKQNEKN